MSNDLESKYSIIRCAASDAYTHGSFRFARASQDRDSDSDSELRRIRLAGRKLKKILIKKNSCVSMRCA